MDEKKIYQDIVSFFENEGLRIRETEIEELQHDHKIDSTAYEQEGVFIPRTKKGYFRSVDNKEENKRRYTHELGHGIFCENFELGSRLSELDEEVFHLGQKIYGQVPREGFVSVPANINGSYLIDQKTAEFIAGEEIQGAEKYFLVQKDLLSEYLDARNELSEFYNKNLQLMEGFSIACEAQIVENLLLDKRPKYQVEGYESFSGLNFQQILAFLNR